MDMACVVCVVYVVDVCSKQFRFLSAQKSLRGTATKS